MFPGSSWAVAWTQFTTPPQTVERKTSASHQRSNAKVTTRPFGRSQGVRGRSFVTALPAASRKNDATRRSSKTSRSAASSNGSNPVENRLVMVLVEVQKEFTPESNLELLGGTSELGFWKRNPKKPSSLQWDENDSVWKGKFFLPAGLCCEFKCMEITSSGYVYEKGNNREIRIPADAGAMVLSFAWGDTATTNSFVLCDYSAADEDTNESSQSAEAADDDESVGKEVLSKERSSRAVFSESLSLWPASAFTVKQRRSRPFPRRFDANAYAPEAAAAGTGRDAPEDVVEAAAADAPAAPFTSSAELWPGSASARQQSSFPRAFSAGLVKSTASETVDGTGVEEGSLDRGEDEAEAREDLGGASGFGEGAEQLWAASARSQQLRASKSFPRAFAPQIDQDEEGEEEAQSVEQQQHQQEEEAEEASVAAAVHFESPERLWPGAAWTKQQRELSSFPRAFAPAASTETVGPSAAVSSSVAFDAPEICWSGSAVAKQQRALHPFPREFSSVPEPEPSVDQPSLVQQQQQIPEKESLQPQPEEPQVKQQKVKQRQQVIDQQQQEHPKQEPQQPQNKQQEQPMQQQPKQPQPQELQIKEHQQPKQQHSKQEPQQTQNNQQEQPMQQQPQPQEPQVKQQEQPMQQQQQMPKQEPQQKQNNQQEQPMQQQPQPQELQLTEQEQLKQQQRQRQQVVIQQRRPSQAQTWTGSGAMKHHRSAKSFPRSFSSADGPSTNSDEETSKEPSSDSRGPWRVSYAVSTLRDRGSFSVAPDAPTEEGNYPEAEATSPWRTSAWANRQRSLGISPRPSEDKPSD